MTIETIHCRSNGTIDTDFYRARAARERRVKIRVHARKLAHTFRNTAAATWRWLTPSGHPMPDPGALMLMAGAAVRNPRL